MNSSTNKSTIPTAPRRKHERNELPTPFNCWLCHFWLDLHVGIIGTATLSAPWLESRLSGPLARLWTAITAFPTLLVFLLTRAVLLILPALVIGAFCGLPAPLTLAPAAPHHAWVEPAIQFICDLWGVTPGTSLTRPAMIAAAVTQYFCAGLVIFLSVLACLLPSLVVWRIVWEVTPWAGHGDYRKFLYALFAFTCTSLCGALWWMRPVRYLPLEVVGFDVAAMHLFAPLWCVASFLWLVAVALTEFALLRAVFRRLPALGRSLASILKPCRVKTH
ncbi:hypothetical protein PAPYR_1424 [Paratrimastix pyriformis]|uniref:Uncharacterized protein n=1 Tax=Paratrimastix pyriformis TaxID=342808 RepID=A0ABQ8USX6_9EUKA|nr:hypothetical protein PAPYR_1424 [Paratrimastix pyriformis]